MTDAINLVCLDAPSPPNYGGAIDMFYKVKALHETGKKIILHYFAYRPNRDAEALRPYCAAVHAYERTTFIGALPFSRPFIVQSRINQHLIRRLNAQPYPVLLEGLHCAGLVPYIENQERVVVRMHNNEAAYYRQLAKAENSVLKKSYFAWEAFLLHRFQQRLDKSLRLACLAETDKAVFEESYGFTHCSFIPCFLPWQTVSSQKGKGTFCLYHGNLSVAENDAAARWLVEHIFSQLNLPFVIAGSQASVPLQRLVARHPHVRLINNPSIAEIERLVQTAHINLLPSMNTTGVKLKLLNAALNGRFCITNRMGIAGSRLQKGVMVCESAQEWTAAIVANMKEEFGDLHQQERQEILSLYNNRENAQKLSALWRHCQ